MLYLISSIIIGLIVYVLGTYTVLVNLYTVAFKFIAITLIVATLIFIYRKFRSRKRPGRPRRLLP